MVPLNTEAEQFILHWGEMSRRWGINRSVAQIHALLYLSDRALNAEEIASTLSIARSNVATSLRELMAWGVVKIVHVMGDRRDYFQAMEDAWDMLLTIVEHRKKREIDPTIEMLRGCVQRDSVAGPGADSSKQRMLELLQILEVVTSWYEQMVRLPRSTQRKILKMGDKLRLLGSRSATT